MYAFNTGVKHSSLKGLDPGPRINPDKPPRNFGDAMKALDKQAWAAAYNSEKSWVQTTRRIQARQTGAGGTDPRHLDEVGI